MKTTKSIKHIFVLGLALLILAGYQFTTAQSSVWSAPTAPPPGDNVPAPVNIGVVSQNKLGAFGAIELFAGDRVKAGLEMWSPQYCDQNGANCWDPSTGTPTTGTPTGGGGVVAAAFPGITVPSGLSKWPDWVKCGAIVANFAGGWTGSNPFYGGWGGSDPQVGYSQTTGGVVKSDSFPCTGNIYTMCASGNCGMYDGSSPVTATTQTYNRSQVFNAVMAAAPAGVTSAVTGNAVRRLATISEGDAVCNAIDPGARYLAGSQKSSTGDIGIIPRANATGWSTVNSAATYVSGSTQNCTGSGRNKTCTSSPTYSFTHPWITELKCIN